MLYIRFPWLTHFIIENLYHLTKIPPFLPPHTPRFWQLLFQWVHFSDSTHMHLKFSHHLKSTTITRCFMQIKLMKSTKQKPLVDRQEIENQSILLRQKIIHYKGRQQERYKGTKNLQNLFPSHILKKSQFILFYVVCWLNYCSCRYFNAFVF
jgi:hypothetical protein